MCVERKEAKRRKCSRIELRLQRIVCIIRTNRVCFSFTNNLNFKVTILVSDKLIE